MSFWNTQPVGNGKESQKIKDTKDSIESGNLMKIFQKL